ncbi:hypothetical protein JHK85_010404 [Glycine max]|nr:hypothetical protein JHK85_010404 [Glycine max]
MTIRVMNEYDLTLKELGGTNPRQLLRFIAALWEMRKPKSPPSPSSNSTTPATAGSQTRFGFKITVGVDGEILPETLQRMLSICDHMFVDIQALVCRFDNINGRVSHVVLRGSGFFYHLPRITFLKASTDEPVFIDVEVRKWCCMVVTHVKDGCEVDPTGAEDCSLGGFLAGIAKGLAMPDAALLGNFFGSIAVAQLGPPKHDFNLIQVCDGIVVKGKAYGICSIRVDGNDALAVYKGKKGQNRFGGKKREEEMLVARQETCDGRVNAQCRHGLLLRSSGTEKATKFKRLALCNHTVGRNIFRQRLEAGDHEADIEQCRVSQFNREA